MAAHQVRPVSATPILVAMAIGAIVGWFLGPEAKILGFFEFLGTLFINLLKMVVVPLISASIVTGVASVGTGRDLGRLGIKTLAFYVFTTLLSVDRAGPGRSHQTWHRERCSRTLAPRVGGG